MMLASLCLRRQQVWSSSSRRRWMHRGILDLLGSSPKQAEARKAEEGRSLDVLVQKILVQMGAKQKKRNEVEVRSAETLAQEKREHFDYYVVVDFEATCDQTPLFPQEIIEFPAVLVEAKSLKVADSFQTYVKPLYNPRLTEFCKTLTGIEQRQVDDGVPLRVALEKHDKWLEDSGVKEKKFGVITWSDWDCSVILEQECKLKGLIKPTYFSKWINLKTVCENYYKEKGRLKQAVVRAGLQWEGREHCGLDDARNTAMLAIELMKRGVYLDYTNSIRAMRSSILPSLQKLLDTSAPSTGTVEAAAAAAAKGAEYVCFCGVKCKIRLVTKPGPNSGKYFVSCGHWTLADGGRCSFSKWESAENIALAVDT